MGNQKLYKGSLQTIILKLLAQNDKGYRNLTELISRAYQHGQHLGTAYIKRSWLVEASQGLIALSAGREGDVGMALVSGKKGQLVNAYSFG